MRRAFLEAWTPMLTTFDLSRYELCSEHARSNALSKEEHSGEDARSNAPNPLLILSLIQRITCGSQRSEPANWPTRQPELLHRGQAGRRPAARRSSFARPRAAGKKPCAWGANCSEGPSTRRGDEHASAQTDSLGPLHSQQRHRTSGSCAVISPSNRPSIRAGPWKALPRLRCLTRTDATEAASRRVDRLSETR
jgi:hypothetical protein